MSDARGRVMSWEEITTQCDALADLLRGADHEVILAIARGGLVPAAMVAQRLNLRNVLVASVASYEGRARADALHFLEFPPDPCLVGRDVLIVDDIWDTGHTAVMVRRRVVEAGGDPTVAVLHYKPRRSVFPDQQPDIWLAETDDWIVYPWEVDQL